MLDKKGFGSNNGYAPNFRCTDVTGIVANDIFTGTGRIYAETIKNIRATKRLSSFYTGKRATIKMNATYNPEIFKI